MELYIRLCETYAKATGVLTFNMRTFVRKFKDTVIAGDIHDGGFVIRSHPIGGTPHYKLVAGFSRWYEHFGDLSELTPESKIFIFVTDDLVNRFHTHGFTPVTDRQEIAKYINDEMTICQGGIEQRIKHITLKKQLLIKEAVA